MKIEKLHLLYILLFISLIFLLFISLPLLLNLDYFIASSIGKIKSASLDFVFSIFTSYIFVAIAFFLIPITLLLLKKTNNKKNKKTIIALLFSLILSTILTFILKIIFHRQRPFQFGFDTLNSLIKNSFLTWDFSFPSFHAIVVSAALVILWKKLPKIKYFLLTSALLVVFSRIYLAMHFLTDVVAGIVFGILIGILINKFFKL